MPDNARVLAFPSRWKADPPLSPDAAKDAAQLYLQSEDRSPADTERYLGNPDVLAAVSKVLRDSLNTNPEFVAREASAAYLWLRDNPSSYLFDEHDYFLGEAALLTAGAERFLGRREEAELWLHRAESAFRHTINPAPHLALAAYTRLAIYFDRRSFETVLELVPSTQRSFDKLGMTAESAKVRFLEAMTLKACSRDAEARTKFKSLGQDLRREADPGLLGQVLVQLGGYHAAEQHHEAAAAAYQEALNLLLAAKRMFAVADLRLNLGETLKFQGQFGAAIGSFRKAVEEYTSLGMKTSVAYARLVLADALLAAGQHRQAEWEILAALPTIEDQKMVPEGFAAIALLRESVRQRKADPNALRELREHLQARN